MGYLKQIASERLVRKKNGGEEWVASRDNHYLDCLVGHTAMAHWQWQPSLARMARVSEPVRPKRPQEEDNPFTGGANLFGD